ncbi:MAG TPA: phosphotransferase [Herpetosiphonaceae bacterium]
MDLPAQLDRALRCCGFPPLQSPSSYRQVGAGAWHDAYLVTLADGEQLVIRLRKQVIYGRQEAFDAQALHEEYAPVGVYYAQAHRCRPGVCPAIYTYHIAPDLICTIESYAGASIDLSSLTTGAALAYGRRVGDFFRAMHAIDPALDGFGLLGWRDGRVAGQEQGDRAAIRQAEVLRIQEQLERVLASDLHFDRARVRRAVEHALEWRGGFDEPIALVNRDITPENLLIKADGALGLVDPVPLLHRPTRYASWFRFCYTFLLPALGDAPRYARHEFKRHAAIMAAIAEGYTAGYTQGDPALRHALDMEERLWLLGSTHDNYQLLNSAISEEQRLRTGGKAAISTSLQLGLRKLEQARLD